MKISNHLPRFEQSTLLVSSGKQECTYYLAYNDDVNLIHSFKIKKPEYTDRESFFSERKSSKNYSSGDSINALEDEFVKNYIRRGTEITTDLVREYGAQKIYLFCPTYLSYQLEQSLPKSLQGQIEYVFYGNYHNQHPFVLISKVQEYLRAERDQKIVEPMTEEAAELRERAPE